MPATMVRPSNMTLAMPSSISRDLRTPSPRTSAAISNDDSCHPRLSNNPAPVSPLLLPTADGAISKICGSVIEPEEQRQRWACHGCKTVFARDATIYLSPTSTSSTSSPLRDASSALNRRLDTSSGVKNHFCKACYTDRFALGSCFACNQAVLGSTKEDGKYVKSGMEGHIWHGRCWKCSTCDTPSGEKDISLGLDGKPVCEECFDRPLIRKNVVPNRPPSPFKEPGPRRVSPHTTLSGSATRQGMGAAIAELSRKFGQPVPKRGSTNLPSTSIVLPQSSSSGRESPIRLTRSNSVTSGVRPLTAQFSGQGFNLAAFRPTTPTSISRSDSRSLSSSPTKLVLGESDERKEEICAKCFKGSFEGPAARARSNTMEAKMISLHGGNVHYHSECFCCAICNQSLENANRSFIRLEEGKFAHPGCAPPAIVERISQSNSIRSAGMTPSLSNSSSVGDRDHATHQRLPRPSTNENGKQHTLPTSYLNGGANKCDSFVPPLSGASSSSYSNQSKSFSQSNRRFQPTSGAAPPTRSTLLHTRPSTDSTMRMNASLAVSSSSNHGAGITNSNPTKFGRLGGMQVCGGCSSTVSGLEGVPGPRGQTWHRKCLVCSAKPVSTNDSSGSTISSKRFSYGIPIVNQCGKQLDSSAKVTSEGQLRCRACYDREHGRHRVIV